jgi:hypothetical protein
VSRADLLLSVLRDGKPHARQEVFDRVGFMLTNNAASELRAQGYNVRHSVDGGSHTYRMVSLLEEGEPEAETALLASSVSQAASNELASPSSSGDALDLPRTYSSPGEAGPDNSPTLVPGQLSLLEAA